MFNKLFLLFLGNLFLIGAAIPNISDPIDFALNDGGGNSYTLSEVKDSKAVVVMFWSAECPNVQAYNTRIVKIVNDYVS